MPTIFDNIDKKLLPELQDTLDVSYRADFCVGYFNLRGWKQLDAKIEDWTGGQGAQCRLLVGMQRRPQDELEAAFSFNEDQEPISNKRATQLRKELAEEFRRQLTIGAPSNEDEAGLRRLSQQLKDGKLVVKLFLRHTLHAKLYLLYREDKKTPIISYMGSSNLTFSGLQGQGELNIDVLEQDAAKKLEQWFIDRWQDQFCIDISQELIEIIEESWAGKKSTPPYYIYLKMAYHLSREARAGLTEFSIPREFGNQLFDFQTAAVKIAARHLNQRGGVLIGDVVGLGKTIMASALAKIFEEDYFMETLIVCPKNLEKMWQWYADEYRLHAKVISITKAQNELPELRRYRLVLIDESHNLRNREGKRYRAIQEYIQQNESRVILLSATPYNKSYLDLSSQLRLFLAEEADLGIRPEQYIREIGEVEFNVRHQANMRSLAAFEQSNNPEDWRELMGLFMVRRTRSFIRDNYAKTDDNGRKYLLMADGRFNYFPDRIPRRVEFALDETDPNDQYARLYAADVVDTINGLNLPRYGLGNYEVKKPKQPPSPREKQLLENLSRGGRRLMGFSRTNLFKRLESSGYAFLLSVERHILRNYIFIYALENDLDLPIGTQGAEMLDTRFEDEDADDIHYDSTALYDDGSDGSDAEANHANNQHLRTADAFQQQAANVYKLYASRYKRRFKWIRPDLFQKQKLLKELRADAENLLLVLQVCGPWDAGRDAQLAALLKLLSQTHPQEKVLIFSQFADTVRYLTQELKARGITDVAGATGDTADPTTLAWRFSPESNGKRHAIAAAHEIRVLVATDILSEGQNLQDAHIVVNFDLPWAIIRLIQRVGRVDRIGQKSSEILAYAFWPVEGVERIIRLRERLHTRLRQNAEVVGTDEQFFEDEDSDEPWEALYHEKSGILDDEQDTDIDLVSHAYQIWKNATDANPSLKNIIPKLPPVVYSTKQHAATPEIGPTGVLVYMNTAQGNSALAWMDQSGNPVSESQFAILRAAACTLDEPAQTRQENHHDWVTQAVKHMMSTSSKQVGGQLGRPSGARFKVYTRLDAYVQKQKGTWFMTLPQNQTLTKALDQVYQFPLRESAKEHLNRQLKANVRDEHLAELVVNLYEEDKLCLVQEEAESQEPRIICSLGLTDDGETKL